MTIIFKNFKQLYFEYYNCMPTASTDQNRQKKLNFDTFQMYCLLRDTFFEVHRNKLDIPEDIKTWKHTFVPEYLKGSSSDILGLYNYSVYGAIEIIKEWQKRHQHTYIVYKNINGQKLKVGLVIFEEKNINKKHFVYIAEAGVYERGKGIGHALMKRVLMHYPEKTTFLIGTRKFNQEAIGLYQNCLKFETLNAQKVKEYMGLDERYYGFVHTTTREELALISNKINNI